MPSINCSGERESAMTSSGERGGNENGSGGFPGQNTDVRGGPAAPDLVIRLDVVSVTSRNSVFRCPLPTELEAKAVQVCSQPPSNIWKHT